MFKRIAARAPLAVAAVGFTFSAAASAQEAAPPSERIEITGSLIKRIEGETALPVQVLTHEDIQRSAANTVEELLQTVTGAPSMGNLVAANTAGANNAGLSGVSLRGLGTNRTLLLINGRRIAPFGNTTDSASVDVNSIPLAAIDRIEILKDGASSIYGSEAIGGVVNFIMRRDFHGIDLSADHGETTEHGGNPTHASVAYGYGDLTQQRFNLSLIGNYEKQDALYGAQRGFANRGFNIPNGNDTTSGNTFPANITWAAVDGAPRNPNAPNCAPSTLDPNFPPNRCRFDPAPYVTLVPEAEREGLFATARFAVTSQLEAFAEFSYAHNKQVFQIQPVPISDQFPIAKSDPLFHDPRNPTAFPYIMPGSNPLFAITGGSPLSTIVLHPGSPYYPTPYMQGQVGAGNPLPDILVRYRSFATGLRNWVDVSEPKRAVLGVKGAVADWDYEASILDSESRVAEKDLGGIPEFSKIMPLLNSGEVNFWGPNTPQIAQALLATDFKDYAYKTKTSLRGVNAKASRDLFTLPGGALAVAAGVEFRQERFSFDPNQLMGNGDIGSHYGGNNLPVDAQRNVDAAYGELDAPLLKSLEADFSARFDHYGGTGSRTNPKASLRYQPAPQVLLRAAAGEGFRAPSLLETKFPTVVAVGVNGVSDPVRCPVTGSSTDCSTQFTDQSGGNPRLRSETSKNLTLGLVFEPNKYVSLEVDWFRTLLKDTISQGLGDGFILSHLATYNNLVTRGANNLVVKGRVIPNSGSITSIDETFLNVGGTVVQGIDFDVKGRAPLDRLGLGELGTLKVDWTGTLFSKFDVQNPDGSWTGYVGAVNPISALGPNGNGGVIPNFRDVTSLVWDYSSWEGVLIRYHQANYVDLASTLSGSQSIVGVYETYDIQGSYLGFKNLRLSLGIKNMFDRAPPYSNSGGQSSFQSGYDPSYGNPLGRLVYGKFTYSIK
jgi:iron complex outermembrane receptor protein